MRSTRKTKRKSSNKTRKNLEDAGAAIAAGGFGCVFRPPIAPKSASDKAKLTNQPYISKLMERRYARDEMAEVNKILPIVSKIPNSQRYFLLDGIFTTEQFGPLTSEDKRNFSSKCRNLTRRGITANNINNNLGGLAVMYIPDGGISVNEAMKQLSTSVGNGMASGIKSFGRFNYALIDTLKHAIVPMNNLGLIHLDLKADNMLVSSNYNNETSLLDIKIIDWGLAGVIPNASSGPIYAAQDRPLQFNCPPSAVLFNTDTKDTINRYFKTIYNSDKKVYTSAVCKNLAAFVIRNSQQNVGQGHSRYIAQEVKNLTRPLNSYRELEGWNVSSECFQNDSNVQAFTVDYVAAIFEKYLKTGKHGGITSNFDDKAYFQEVYRYNVDVWGFLTAYQDLIANIASSSYTAYRNSVICQLLSDVLFKYCYSPEYATKRIPIDQLADDLEKISFAAGVKKAPSRLAAAKAKKIKKKMVLRQASPAAAAAATRLASVISLPAGKKRCPNGYSKDPDDPRKCRKKGTRKKKSAPAKKAKAVKKPKSKKKRQKKAAPKPKKAKSPEKITMFKANGATYARLPQGRKRCPKGFKRVLGGEANAPHVRILCEKVAK